MKFFEKQTKEQRRENWKIVVFLLVVGVVAFLFYSYVFQSHSFKVADWGERAEEYCENNLDDDICYDYIIDNDWSFEYGKPRPIYLFSCDELVKGLDVVRNLRYKNRLSKNLWLKFGRFTEEDYMSQVEVTCKVSGGEDDACKNVLEVIKGKATLCNGEAERDWWFPDEVKPDGCSVWSCGYTLNDNPDITDVCLCRKWRGE